MRMRRVPKHLQVKVIKWFDYLWLTQKCSDEEKAVSCLPGKFSFVRKRKILDIANVHLKRKIRKNLKMKKISNERLFLVIYSTGFASFLHECFFSSPYFFSYMWIACQDSFHRIYFHFIFFFVVTAILFRFTSKVFLLDFYLVQTSKYIWNKKI